MSSMPMRFRIVSCLAALVLAGGGAAGAQTPESADAADSVFARARQLVASGDGAAGRMLVDSMLAAASPGTRDYADALYWRAALSPTSAEAEPDYTRIIVEYPLSSHAADALLQLAQIEIARGDRAGAEAHLGRFLLENPQRPDRGRAGFLLTRLYMNDRNDARACAVLARTIDAVPPDSVELRNQFDFLARRCEGVDTTHAAAPPPVRAANPPPAREAPAQSRPAKAQPRESQAAKSQPVKSQPSGRYSVQVAAYGRRSAAQALADKLVKRGIDARVDGTVKPFRVRIGHYATRGAAQRAARALAARGIQGFIADTGPDDR